MTVSKTSPISFRFFVQHPAHVIALGFGTGLLRPAPGTWGTLPAIPIAWALSIANDICLWVAVIALLLIVGTWATYVTGKNLGEVDHSGIVIDEIAAFVIVLLFVPMTPVMVLIAFVLFRFFDIVKPPPIKAIDQRVKNCIGVMLDDIIAAAYTLLLMAVLHRLWSL
jgi:Phosphatidylglycerophosphatase A and related proteins